MTELARRQCRVCGDVFYEDAELPLTDLCKFHEIEERKIKMTTVQLRDDMDQTTEETEEKPEPVTTAEAEPNGDPEEPKTTTRKRGRKPALAAVGTNGHTTEDKVSYIDTVKARATGIVDEVTREIEQRELQISTLEDEVQELRKVKASLTGTPAPVSDDEGPHTKRAIIATKAAAPKSKPGRRPRRSSDEIAEQAGEVLSLLKKKGALKTEAIRAALNIEKENWLSIAKHLKEMKGVKTTGEKRATTWQAR